MEMEEGEDGDELRMEHLREDKEGLTKNEESPRKTFLSQVSGDGHYSSSAAVTFSPRFFDFRRFLL